MLVLGGIAFASPWILTALAALPALVWLMRVTPPAPQRIAFPAVRLLFGLRTTEETPARTPLWLVILRACVAGLIILSLAQPILNPSAALSGRGPVLLVVDDGWAAAGNWRTRQGTLATLLDRADRDGRPVAVLTTAPPADGAPIQVQGVTTAAVARQVVQGMAPKPWPPARAAARAALAQATLSRPVEVFWLTDSLAQARPPEAGEAEGDADTRAFVEALAELGPVHVVADAADALALLLAPEDEGAALAFTVRRPAPARERTVWVRASTERSQILARRAVVLPAGETAAHIELDLPAELRNRLTRVEIEQEDSAGAVVLVDERWRRRPVGLVSGETAADADQPLLSARHYIGRALAPYAEMRSGELDGFLEQPPAVLVLADTGRATGADAARLDRWVTEGGVLVRFAGPRTARAGADLVPARLRPGERAMGGAMAWAEPARLAPFPEASPFHGLRVPDDVRVHRQVLAEPTIDIGESLGRGLRTARRWSRARGTAPAGSCCSTRRRTPSGRT